jgi:hypothetical protein
VFGFDELLKHAFEFVVSQADGYFHCKFSFGALT